MKHPAPVSAFPERIRTALIDDMRRACMAGTDLGGVCSKSHLKSSNEHLLLYYRISNKIEKKKKKTKAFYHYKFS